ncbi:MAG: M48 family metallopeptidase [Aquimonas sp.]|nr:M48 family metallopeptidase [Aquimonas sp.]
MNFFERQARTRQQSRRLILLFAAAVACIVLAVAGVVFAMLLWSYTPRELAALGGGWGVLAQSWSLLLGVALVTATVIGCCSLYRVASLSGGGRSVARAMGGREIGEDTRDPELRRLRNVVEEMAIASSVPVPAIFVLEDEPAINAFAAGYSTSDAAVAVSRGALLHLNRDELQGVVAHEFSHVLNGDMRLNIRLMGALFGILALGVIGARILEYSRHGRVGRDGAPVIGIALALVVVGYGGLFFGRVIKAAVSRQREYLADASAVQFTRQTQGIAGALKKIAGLSVGSRLKSAETEEVAHMLFGEGMGFSGLFATHPPLHERIRAIDPGYSRAELERLRAQWLTRPPHGLEEDLALGFAAQGASLPAADQAIPLQAERVVAHVATPDERDYLRAGALRSAIPPAIEAALQVPERAQALLLGLLLDLRPSLRGPQLHAVRELLGAEAAQALQVESAQLSGLHPALRLPIVLLALPTVRHLGRAGQQRLAEAVDAMVHADGQLDLFEFALGLLLGRQIEDSLQPSRRARGALVKLGSVAEHAADLLAVLAAHGHADEVEARRAYLSALHTCLPQLARPYRAPADWRHSLEQALPKLDAVDPAGKRLLVEALAVAIAHDGEVTLLEAELLRTVCAYLGCPLPPGF